MQVVATKLATDPSDWYCTPGHANGVPVRVWRNTGATMSVVKTTLLPGAREVGRYKIKGVGGTTLNVPVVQVHITTPLYIRSLAMAVAEVPKEGIDILLGNDV